MDPFAPTARRGFLTRLAGAAAAVGIGGTLPRSVAAQAAQSAPQDAWLDKLTGAHRCLFDFPNHGAGVPLIHMLNYLNTYATVYGTKPGQVNAIGTFYFVGPTASIPLAFNDAAWAKYKLGAYLKLDDPATKAPSARNMFNAPKPGDPVLFGGQVAPASIASLQKMGATFLLCNNAFGIFVGQLAEQGMGTAADIDRDLRANLLPGVVVVPAMVIAIEKAQSKGIAYNKQG
jgi:intracellular sulfur oxidation DsrE/DsrF family protein